ncbi:MAG TPA: hemolysin family protein [Myxococcaceae bacterium]|nr:hemolysin family protein [Myxococcaceae bacterium]
MPTWGLWLACVGFLLVRALIAAVDSALHGISDLRAKELAEAHRSAGARVLRHKLEREASAASIRLGMVLSGFLAAGIGALAPPRMLDVSRFGSDWPGLLTPIAGVLLVSIIATLLDVTARAVAIASPEIAALRLSWIVSVLVTLFYPPMRLVVGILDLFVRPFGGRVRFESPPPPLEELEKLLEAQAAANEVDKGAPQLIRSIFELSDKRCRDVMVPRTDVVSIELTTPPTEILRILAEESHSRLPVYQDDVDHIVGILHTRDLIPLLQHPELIVLQDIIRPATFVPWVKPIGDLLREMQGLRIHMAVVVDEYGGMMGVVTLEDILREIVGDIGDEFSVEERAFEKLPDGTWLVDASVPIGEFAQHFGVTVPEGEYETLAGFLSSLTGALPEVGERLTWNGWQFLVHSKAGARLDRIKVTRPRGAAQPAAAPGATPATPATAPSGRAS